MDNRSILCVDYFSFWGGVFVEIAKIILLILLSPIAGGILFGVDRKITARMQHRKGPPIVQPFYDTIKLFAKGQISVNRFQMVSVSVYLACMILSLVLLAAGQDLLVLLFILALGHVMLILGGFSVKSPYSQIGSQREILQLMAYEPLLVFMVIAAYLRTGSFLISSIFDKLPNQPLLPWLPAFFITQIIVMAIKLHKSPFDISASHHAHQELVRGIYTEFSGSQLALIEIAHWYELILLMGFIALLWQTNLIIGGLLAFAAFLIVLVIDNITARMTWKWMLKFAWTFGLGISLANLAVIYVLGGGMK
jgi:formate hydrogenlyase subunit 4